MKKLRIFLVAAALVFVLGTGSATAVGDIGGSSIGLIDLSPITTSINQLNTDIQTKLPIIIANESEARIDKGIDTFRQKVLLEPGEKSYQNFMEVYSKKPELDEKKSAKVTGFLVAAFVLVLFSYNLLPLVVGGMGSPVARETMKGQLKNLVFMLAGLYASYYIYTSVYEMSLAGAKYLIWKEKVQFLNPVNASADFFTTLYTVIVVSMAEIFVKTRLFLTEFGVLILPFAWVMYNSSWEEFEALGAKAIATLTLFLAMPIVDALLLMTLTGTTDFVFVSLLAFVIINYYVITGTLKSLVSPVKDAIGSLRRFTVVGVIR
ncbi:MAG: hypothetical protein QF775_04055 [archaeon]|nr:hypothetical protein [Euryarchaeota archaeon]MDP6704631.1 hypothetical protein [archaeon]|tara:strand:+ start:14785 stop:15744 length:960 start_codon:yes stop_codon:yes gene_type:complete